MSLRVLLRDHGQRSIAIVTSTHALTFRHAPSVPSNSSASKSTLPRCMVEFIAVDRIDLTVYRSIPRLGVHGTLGLINVNTDIFLCVITAASPVAELRPREHVQRIVSVEFCELRSNWAEKISTEIMQIVSTRVIMTESYSKILINTTPKMHQRNHSNIFRGQSTMKDL